MNLIDEKVILSAAKSYSKIGEANRYDCNKLDAFIQGALEAQQQLQPFIVELLDWLKGQPILMCKADNGHQWASSYMGGGYFTSEQLLEEFIEFKNKQK